MTAAHAPTELTVSDARREFAEVTDLAKYNGHTTYVTKHGRRIAAVVPVEDAELLEELEDRGLLRMALEAEAEIEAGARPKSRAELRAELGL